MRKQGFGGCDPMSKSSRLSLAGRVVQSVPATDTWNGRSDYLTLCKPEGPQVLFGEV